MILKIVAAIVGIVVLIGLGSTAFLYAQGRRKPPTSGQYVALGSSYAAGIGLGPRAPGSPLVCARTTEGYPSLLARRLGLSLVDMSCSASTTTHILDGGQVFLGPQLDAVGPAARLVTITSGGNDVGYVGDLMRAANKGGAVGRLFFGSLKPVAERDFGAVTDNLVRIVAEIRRRAPQAKVVIVSYPTVLPPTATCDTLGIGTDAAALSRDVAARLLAATRAAADRSGAIFVDMDAPGTGHDACSAHPWVNGASPSVGTAFHPNTDGAQAMADAIAKAIAS